MGLRETIIRRLGGNITKSNPVPSRNVALGIGGIISSSFQRGDLERFLKAYGENPWVHAAVNRIAESVGETIWRYNEIDADGDSQEVSDQNDPLKIVLNNPNPDMTGQDLVELTEKFLLLTGKAYWTVQKDKGKTELWLLPSPWLHPVTDNKTNTIIGYMWDRDGKQKPFNRDIIIPFVISDPFDLLNGAGPAMTIGDDIDTMSFARLFNKYFFYYGGDPGTILVFKDDLTQEEADRITQKYNAVHQSYGKSHKFMAIGGDATVIKEGETRKDMEFQELMKNTRDTILGAFGVSYSVLGGTESVNRANAEAQNFTFASLTLRPKLQFLKRKMNKYLVPLFYKSEGSKRRELDFDDPTPENTEQTATLTDNHIKASVFSIEEGRQLLGMGDINPEDHFMVPISMQIVTGQQLIQAQDVEPPAQPPGKGIKFNDQHDPDNGQFTGDGGGGASAASERASRAKATYKPASKFAQDKASESEKSLASAVNGRQTADNEPFDVIVGSNAIECKTIVSGENDKITMHPDSLARKEKAVSENNYIPHTVVIDARSNSVYYRQGLGSFRLSSMTKVDGGFSGLGAYIK